MNPPEEQIIADPQALQSCCAYLAGCERLGFDTEFVGEETYHPHLCLVQVATANRLILIDPLSAGPLDAFWKLLVDPARQVIVHAGREEVRLCRLWSGQAPGDLFDLQIAAGLVGLHYPLSHGNLVSQVLGVQIAKHETLTEWRHRPLTASQVGYAFDDVRYLLPLWGKISAELDENRRLDWAREEFARLTGNGVLEEGSEGLPKERWRKLRGLGSLDRRRLALVRELYGWRDEEAARANRPARTIVRDDLLIEIARRNPTKPRDLQVVRGLAKRYVDAILQAVAAARSLPINKCPQATERELDLPQLGFVTNILMAVLGDLCARNRLAQSLVATSSDIKLLVRSRWQNTPLPSECLLTQGWRAEHILPELLAVLEGKRSIRVADLATEAPLGYADND